MPPREGAARPRARGGDGDGDGELWRQMGVRSVGVHDALGIYTHDVHRRWGSVFWRSWARVSCVASRYGLTPSASSSSLCLFLAVASFTVVFLAPSDPALPRRRSACRTMAAGVLLRSVPLSSVIPVCRLTACSDEDPALLSPRFLPGVHQCRRRRRVGVALVHALVLQRCAS